MSEYGELLGVTHKGTLEFFWSELKEVLENKADNEHTLYVASVLAHFAQVSTTSSGIVLSTPSSLVQVFEYFVMDSSMKEDAEMMEIAGNQSLLLTGFFQNQLRRRHNIDWYRELGAGFFRTSGILYQKRSPKRSHVLCGVAEDFSILSQACAVIGEKLMQNRYNQSLIKVRGES